MSDTPQHPYPVGSKVRHINQEWATGETFTAEITAVHEPYGDRTYEYTVLAGMFFAQRLDDIDNPMARPSLWSSRAIRLVSLPEDVTEFLT